MMFPERRQHPRLEGNIPVKICSDDFDIVTETGNLSRTGSYCKVDKYIEPMTKLKIHLLIPLKRGQKIVTKKISCDGVVVRTESVPGQPFYNVAVYFSDIHSKDADYIAEYVKTALTHKESSRGPQ
jgi:hypothetical protein